MGEVLGVNVGRGPIMDMGSVARPQRARRTLLEVLALAVVSRLGRTLPGEEPAALALRAARLGRLDLTW